MYAVCPRAFYRLAFVPAHSPIASGVVSSTIRAGSRNRSTLPSRRTFSCSSQCGKEEKPSDELDKIYDELLDQPLSNTQPQTPGTPSAPPPSDPPRTPREETIQKARVVFGSRLAGPAERQRELDNMSKNIAGVLVPPRPTEPDNCCMSGCVNCVWDRYQEEVEDWATKSAEARAKMNDIRMSKEQQKPAADVPNHVMTSMDDDGGGSETLWTGAHDESLLAAGGNVEDLMQDVPIGIREFMKNEKKLKQRKAAAA